MEVLKLHHYLGPDVNTAVINAVLEALSINSNCQALYIQNFNDGFQDEQVRSGLGWWNQLATGRWAGEGCALWPLVVRWAGECWCFFSSSFFYFLGGWGAI